MKTPTRKEISTTPISDKIERLNAERDYCFAVLKLWEAAKKAGHKHDDISAFAFRLDYLNKAQTRANMRAQFGVRGGRNQPFNQYVYHNCVRLISTGELAEIPLTLRPIR